MRLRSNYIKRKNGNELFCEYWCAGCESRLADRSLRKIINYLCLLAFGVFCAMMSSAYLGNGGFWEVAVFGGGSIAAIASAVYELAIPTPRKIRPVGKTNTSH